jgi:hypothetical protein
MSYDPYAYGSDAPQPDDADDASMPRYSHTQSIKARVQAPAVCLIVVGILNIFWALYMLVNGIFWTVAADYIIAQEKQLLPGLQQQGADRNQMQMQGILISYPTALFAFVASVLPVAGGIRMLSLKSYSLALCGAISAAIPCISITACCGLGEVAGIWALVVLINEEVKSAFR